MSESRSSQKAAHWPHSLMWYNAPGADWKEQGLPIGNGRLAAMVVAGEQNDRLALNHEHLWRGRHRKRDTEPRHHALEKVRRLFFEGKVLEAGELANEALGGLGGVSGRPNRVYPYQPAGDLLVELSPEPVSDYRRELDLDRALVRVSYKSRGAEFVREYFAHSTQPVIAARLSGTEPFRVRLNLRRVEDPECDLKPFCTADSIGYTGRFPEGIQFVVAARIITKGSLRCVSEPAAAAEIEAAEAVVILSIAVNVEDRNPRPQCFRQIAAARGAWKQLLRATCGRTVHCTGGCGWRSATSSRSARQTSVWLTSAKVGQMRD